MLLWESLFVHIQIQSLINEIPNSTWNAKGPIPIRIEIDYEWEELYVSCKRLFGRSEL